MRHSELNPGGNLVLDIGGDVGALILYAHEGLCEQEVEISPLSDDSRRIHTAIHRLQVAGRDVFAGVFPELRAGTYRIWTDVPGDVDKVTIVGGQVTEVDWR